MSYSASQVLAMSFEQIEAMNDRELRQALTAMNSAANKRLRRLEQAGLSGFSPAALARSGMLFKSPGRSAERWQLESALAEVRQFMGSPSSTSKGARTYRTAIESAPGGDDWTVDELMDYIYQYDAIRTEREDLGSQRVRSICSTFNNPREAIAEIIRQWEAMKSEAERQSSAVAESIRRAGDASGGRNVYDAWVEVEDFEGMPF